MGEERHPVLFKETVSQSLADTATGSGATHSCRSSQIRAVVFADQAGTLFIQQSYDGSTWRTTDTTTTLASTAKALNGFAARPFVRVSFTNASGGAACSVVELDCALIP